MSDKLDVLALEEADLRAYAVEHGDALARVLQRMKDKNRPFVLSWNWLAFLLAPAWLAYRRMWITLAVLVALFIGMGVVEVAYTIDFGGNIGTAVAVMMGMFGKLWVIQNAAKAVRKADDLGLDWPERDEFLASKGGVSVVGGWVTGLIYVALIALSIWAIVSGI